MKLTFVEIWMIFVVILTVNAVVVQAFVGLLRCRECGRYLEVNYPERYPDMVKEMEDCLWGRKKWSEVKYDDHEIAKFISFARKSIRFFTAFGLFFCINLEICILWEVGVRRRFSNVDIGTWGVLLMPFVLIISLISFRNSYIKNLEDDKEKVERMNHQKSDSESYQ